MIEAPHLKFPVTNATREASVRSAVLEAAAPAPIDEQVIERAFEASYALTMNLQQHALPEAYLMLRRLSEPTGMEVISIDHGPGIPAQVQRLLEENDQPRAGASEDGIFLPRRLGQGLPRVKALADRFEVFSKPNIGTVLVSRFYETGYRISKSFPLRCGVVSTSIEADGCGDGWGWVSAGACFSALVVDGLGHGPQAAAAAQAAVASLRDAPDTSVEDYFPRANAAMRKTRGGAVSLCRIDINNNSLQFAGAGNVEARVFRKIRDSGLMPVPGTLGVSMTAPKVHITSGEWEPGASLVMHTDGLRIRFEDRIRRLTRNSDPVVLAALLHRDHLKGNDDAAVLVIHDTRPEIA